jgi:hypothetical protein
MIGRLQGVGEGDILRLGEGRVYSTTGTVVGHAVKKHPLRYGNLLRG